jgi:pimeloyl-ACP methyl ester carboxylesterase|tara:strand:- start:5799 stop:6530 length:732 start_codon:yes stop_codon:yes gene_type:complete
VKPEGDSSHSLEGDFATKPPPGDTGTGTDPVGISTVVLIHGVLMSGHEMSLLRSRLQRRGFKVRQFRYHSRRQTPVENARFLSETLAKWRLKGSVHFVAHSLGGVVLAHFLAQYQWHCPGRVVLLGGPLRGSRVAEDLSHKGWGRWLLGRSLVDGLLEGAPSQWRPDQTLMIAGKWSFGLATLLPATRLCGPNDGVVRLCETEDAAISHRLTLPANHMLLLFSRRVEKAIADFLTTGSIERVA